MKCESCGSENPEKSKYCQYCGATLENETLLNGEKIENSSDCEKLDKKIEDKSVNPINMKKYEGYYKFGYWGGIISFICAFFPFLSMPVTEFAIVALVFAICGKKFKPNDNKGIIFASLAIALSIVTTIIFAILLEGFVYSILGDFYAFE